MNAASKVDPYQAAFQNAFRAELYEIIDSLPLPSRGRVIDVPCGDGFYTSRLAERLSPQIQLHAVDGSKELLEEVRKRTSKTTVHAVLADAYRLPFENETFEFVWCAQSLISLEPVRAVEEMFRICKSDGVVFILEVDQFHHVLLPWPTELEVALNSAVYAASVQKYGDGTKLAPARRLRRVLKRAGFRDVRRMAFPFERTAPFDHAAEEFLERHIEHLRSLAYPHLPEAMKQRFDEYTDPASEKSLLNSQDTELECMNVVYCARKV